MTEKFIFNRLVTLEKDFIEETDSWILHADMIDQAIAQQCSSIRLIETTRKTIFLITVEKFIAHRSEIAVNGIRYYAIGRKYFIRMLTDLEMIRRIQRPQPPL